MAEAIAADYHKLRLAESKTEALLPHKQNICHDL